MCGKGTQTSSQQVAAPNPAAMGAYNTAMAQIGAATSQPFQKYSSKASDYIAPLTGTQTGAISNITGMAGMSQPYYQSAANMVSGAGTTMTPDVVGKYMSPYMSQVVDPVKASMEQQFGQQLSQQQAQAIKAGAFGGERAGLQRAQLQGQQGLALGQALSPLYQTGYGQALQAAQGDLARQLQAGSQMGVLGSGAQSAALQQAMAQLQGGTLEQQTGTAGLQALYNEFQKQRMYPLQVAQLYAQAAGALGPLMGSYQQTSQPQPFFGGLFAGGGSVDSYSEGLGRARMGGAVDNAGDYARGGYADGGYSGDLSGLVEQQRAALGLNAPKEEVAFPTGSFQTGRAPEHGQVPERRKGVVEQALGAALKDPGKTYDTAKDIGSSLKTGFKFLTDGPGSLAGFADGGDVEDRAMQDLTNNPIRASEPLKPDAPPEKKKSGLGALLKTGASMAANVFFPGSGAAVDAGLSALGMADGGRAGYAGGGLSARDLYNYYINDLGANINEARMLTSAAGAESAYDPRSVHDKGTGYGLFGHRLDRLEAMRRASGEQYPSWQNQAKFSLSELRGRPEHSMLEGENLTPQQLTLAQMHYEMPQGYTRKNPMAAPSWGSRLARTKGIIEGFDNLGRPVGLDAAREGIAKMREEIPPGDPRRNYVGLYPDRPTTQAPTPAAGLGSAQVKDESFLERTQRHPESLILPVLQGLGAMAGSRSKYLGSALLEGLGAGAGSYMDMAAKQAEIDKIRQGTATEAEETRRKAAEVGQVQATTGLLGAETGEKVMNIAGGAFKQVGNEWFVLNDKGQWVSLEKWRQEGGPLVGGAPAAAAAHSLMVGASGATPPAMLPGSTPPGTAVPPPAATQPPPMPPSTPVAIAPGVVWSPDAEKLAKNEFGKFTGPGGPAMQAKSDQYVAKTTQDSDSAVSTRPMHADVAKIIAQAATQKGLNAPGVGFSATSGIIGALNRIANAAGISGDVFGSARTQQDLSDKLNGISGRLAQLQGGSQAYGALESAIRTMPDLNKTPAAAAENAADNIMNNQRAVDRLAHMRKYGSISNNRFSDADTAFNAANPSVKYSKERDAIRDLILGKIPTPEGARTNVRKAHEILEKMYDPNVPTSVIDKFFKEHYGLENMSRYFR